MDYEDLLHLHVEENADSGRRLYRPIKSKDDISPVGRIEFEKAKNMLSVVSSKSNLSLYDHLVAILHKTLRHGIEDAVDKLEDISFSLKDEKQSEENEFIKVTPPNEVLLKFIEDKKRFYKLTPVASKEELKTAEEDEEEEDESTPLQKPPAEAEEVESEVDIAASLSDLHFSMQRFALAGIGLDPIEVHDLVLAMKDLIETYKIGEVRFWGKVFARHCDYYIVESKYSDEVTPEDFGWTLDKKEEEKEEVDEDEEGAEEVSTEEAEDEGEEDVEGGEGGEEEETGPKIPPLPERRPAKRKTVTSEKGGTGVNERLYFVSTKVDGSWRCLPLLKPFHITEARRAKRFLSGNLESEIGGGVPFSGKEAHYLRAQIARISASTCVAPVDYYELLEEEEEDEEHPLGFLKSESYEPKSVMEMFTEGLEAWVHCKPAILDQGRYSPMQEGEEDEEEEAEEEEENEDEEGSEIFEAKKELEVPKLRSLSEDEAIGKLQPWNIKLSSKLVKKVSIIILQSNLWPGAFTFYDGKSFDHIYIGFGYKFSTYHYGPTIPIVFQKEYESGSDIVETEDVEVEEEPPEEVHEEEEEEEEGENEGEELEEENEDEPEEED
ncbi:Radial spoke head protein 6 like protein [Argiope bruennichi]|uniref:Radial spoke head protein 6 like protein n=1 Tax=Argiope bruennichi TaxID=94029 RepID=A0A8T0F5L7_ARGBR|nr:Radial spoke head protein 6 like protein [Argiope bruennichi]